MENDKSNEVYSNAVRAGKRTYFFDVKATKGNELYLTLTESKKTFADGRESYQKHKIFLYKEDFEKFHEGLTEALEKINELNASGDYRMESETASSESYSEVSFDDL